MSGSDRGKRTTEFFLTQIKTSLQRDTRQKHHARGNKPRTWRKRILPLSLFMDKQNLEKNKMKIEVELEDYELNGDDWENELKDYLKTTYFQALKERIDEKIDAELRRTIKEKMQVALDNHITACIEERFSAQEIYFKETFYHSSQKCTLDEYLIKIMEGFTYTHTEKLIQRRCNEVIEALTKKYDDTYATAIISHLYKNNFLSENLHNLLSKEEK